MKRYVGMDLHKRLLVVAIVDDQGQIVKEKRMESVTQHSLEAFCQTVLTAEDEVVLEATTHVWAVVRIVERFVARVVVSNPVATQAIAAAKVKCDKVDARVLAHLLRLDYLPTVWQPDTPLSRLRELTTRRSRLVSQRTAVINRIRTTLAMRLLDCPHGLTCAQGRAWLSAVELDEDGRFLVDGDLRLLDALQSEIDQLDQRLAQRAAQDAQVKLLMTMPGVSVNVAQSLVAAIGNVKRFADADRLASYLGLVPRTRQSANKCYHGSISKAGRSHTRWMLVEAAHTAARDPGPLGHFFNKVRRRKSYNVAVVALARKMALIVWHLLTTNKPYRYAKPDSVAKKLDKLRIAGTGVKRRGGVPKGVDPRTVRNLAPGLTQRSPGLDAVLQREELPVTDSLKPGEAKHLANLGLTEYPKQLQQPVLRKRSPKKKQQTPAATE